eukprot:CAMPEP_0167755814 /NCGR_PEP_ID=MMETSP0110_2-20121227/9033_1 /TAXON_ID=629695 /ORGANISM="Gymnochlora sp., Strain CCMP2014" /LENGTH=1105 /DNA_ID=CAMNT_0007641843 /DNA_START=8 /DNA_END=3325 /DNA_ORIENTATION=-
MATENFDDILNSFFGAEDSSKGAKSKPKQSKAGGHKQTADQSDPVRELKMHLERARKKKEIEDKKKLDLQDTEDFTSWVTASVTAPPGVKNIIPRLPSSGPPPVPAPKPQQNAPNMQRHKSTDSFIDSIQWPEFNLGTRTEQSKSAESLNPHVNKMGAISKSDQSVRSKENSKEETKWKDQMMVLNQMGFTDISKNEKLLARYNGDINKALNMLIGPPIHTPTKTPKNSSSHPDGKKSQSNPDLRLIIDSSQAQAAKPKALIVKCKNCGAKLKVPEGAKKLRCGACNYIFSVHTKTPARKIRDINMHIKSSAAQRRKSFASRSNTLAPRMSKARRASDFNIDYVEKKDLLEGKNHFDVPRSSSHKEEKSQQNLAANNKPKLSKSTPTSPEMVLRNAVRPPPKLNRGATMPAKPSKIERMDTLNDLIPTPATSSELDSANTSMMFLDELTQLSSHSETKAPTADEKLFRKKSWNAEEWKKRGKKRVNVVKEIISSEAVYVKRLKEILVKYVYPLQGQEYNEENLPNIRPRNSSGLNLSDAKEGGSKSFTEDRVKKRRFSTIMRQETKAALMRASKQKRKPIIDSAEAGKIFSTISLIYALNKQFLENLQTDQDVGHTFDEFAQYFNMYKPYVQNHEIATIEIKRLKKSSSGFRNKLKEIEKTSQPLASLLIEPIQRIPRYRLLLEELIKNTHHTDKSYQKLVNVLLAIRGVAEKVNKSVLSRIEAEKLKEIQSRFGGAVDIVAPHRKFIMSQSMKKVTKGGNPVKRVFFLFSDLLIYGSDDVTFSNSLRLRQRMPIDKSFLVSDVLHFGNRQSAHLLYVSSSVKNITISFENEKDKNKWKRSLIKCMEDRRQKIGFDYNNRRPKATTKQMKQCDTSVFTSYSYGSAGEELGKSDPVFYEKMKHIVLTKQYFESLKEQTARYLSEQQSLIKSSTAFSEKMKGEYNLNCPWYRALDMTSDMIAIHSHEMLRWKSVTELLNDSISWVLKVPVHSAVVDLSSFAKAASDLLSAKRALEHIQQKKTPDVRKVKSAGDAKVDAEKKYELAKKAALDGWVKMNKAIQKDFLKKLKLFLEVQADFHKDCYYDIKEPMNFFKTHDVTNIPDLKNP